MEKMRSTFVFEYKLHGRRNREKTKHYFHQICFIAQALEGDKKWKRNRNMLLYIQNNKKRNITLRNVEQNGPFM